MDPRHGSRSGGRFFFVAGFAVRRAKASAVARVRAEKARTASRYAPAEASSSTAGAYTAPSSPGATRMRHSEYLLKNAVQSLMRQGTRAVSAIRVPFPVSVYRESSLPKSAIYTTFAESHKLQRQFQSVTRRFRHSHQYLRSSARSCTASAACAAVIVSLPARSAMVRATRRIRS